MYKLSGFDHCITGVVSGGNSEKRIAYSLDAVIRTLVAKHDITPASAYEFFIDNLLHAELGDEGPVFHEAADISDIEQGETRLQIILDSKTEDKH